jgi:HK97 gp10 family phage protein
MTVETVRIVGLAGVMKTLRALPPALVSKNGGPVRAALRKAALVIQKQESANLQAIIDTPNIDAGVKAEATGLLEKNIIVKRSRPDPGVKGERYLIQVRRKSYPATKGKNVTTPQVARLLETGTAKRRPYPFIRPAFDAKKAEAVAVFVIEIKRNLDRLVKKVALANGAKF